MTTWDTSDFNPDDFATFRHIGPSHAEMAAMLEAIGVGSLYELIDQAVPGGSARVRRSPGRRSLSTR
ncbi:hypothetical protein [Tessaracoccus massiliensis]|uniref:hypothetical protein n=1 Tax=Tessaracoccus massiliensis TaxID=1522311 RepID=UPI001FF02429|nr:hypothetical protein [Tessaracoccus massiliensis]